MDGRSLIDVASDRHSYCRAEFGVRSMRTMDAFQALSQAYRQAGMRIDGLREHIQDEWERFQTNLIHGVDGHVYWRTKDRDFALNDRPHTMHATYFWWRQIYGSRPFRLSYCTTPGCISPYHARLEDKRPRERLFSDETIIGAIQVWALRHGRAPGAKEWERAKMTPSSSTIHTRFGSFDNAVAAAGLPPKPRHNNEVSAETCLEHIYRAARDLGGWPSSESYQAHAVGRYVSPVTIRKYFGGFPPARDAARERYPAL